MLVRGVEDIQAVSEQAALLGVAMRVARDKGIGRAMSRTGSGLEWLSDRAAALGAVLDLDSPRGGPTTIRLEIPVAR